MPVAGTAVRAATRAAAREAAALLTMLLVIGVVGLAFAWPWLPRPSPGGEALARYAPIRDGDARLLVRSAPDGTTIGWESQNTRVVPGLRLYTDIRKAPSDVILHGVDRRSTDPAGGGTSELDDLQIVEGRVVSLDPDGKVRNNAAVAVRHADGDFLVGFTDQESDRDVIFDPPPLLLPPSLTIGASWTREGTVGSVRYRWDGQVLEQGAYEGPLGRFDDCLLTETRFTVIRDDSSDVTRTRDRWCARMGILESDTLDPETGALQNRLAVVAGDGPQTVANALPPAPVVLDAPPAPVDLDAWRIRRVGRARASGEATETTIPPTWLPTDPPVVLVAGYAGDLVAFDASVGGGLVRWRFHADGTIYGPPGFDPTTSRIYVGASDKRLYALDGRGLFLWSFHTGDNVVTRPVVAGDLVVFGSEDGAVYGLDAATGAPRWTRQTGGAVVSSPAVVGDVVAIGSDDQTVYGLDTRTGEQRWTYSAGGAVEAPIVTDGEVLFVASRDGTLAALPAVSCEGACAASWEIKPGAALRSAPLVAAGRVLVVDGDGTLVAIDKDNGRRLWTDLGRGYVGTPVLAGETVVVAAAKGDVYRLGLDGERRGGWSAADAVTAADAAPQFALGPTLGGDGVWIADTGAVVRRIGSPLLGDIPSLRLAWYDQIGRPPFAQDHVRWTPVEYAGRVLVLDLGKRVIALDPATGTGELLATLPGDRALSQIAPVVSGDTLLAIREQQLQAFDLRGRRELWQAAGEGLTMRPPVVAGDAVLWVTLQEGRATLQAIDLATGAPRWQAALPETIRGTGPLVGDGVVYVSAPPSAFDLTTGATRWQLPMEGTPVGGPALSEDGTTVYVGMLRADGSGGVLALDAATGAERWRATLTDTVLNPVEQIWRDGNVLVLPGLDGKIVALDAATGAERWKYSPPVARLGGVTVERGRVWFMLENARFFVLDVQTGRAVARLADIDLNLNGSGLTQRPLVIGDRVLMPIAMHVLGLAVPEGTP